MRGNQYMDVDASMIPLFKPFMDHLREKNMPITVHCDVGLQDIKDREQLMWRPIDNARW